MGSKFSAGVVLGALSGLLASPFDLVRIRPVKAETGQKRITIGGGMWMGSIVANVLCFPRHARITCSQIPRIFKCVQPVLLILTIFTSPCRVQAEAGLISNGLLTTGLRAGHACRITNSAPWH